MPLLFLRVVGLTVLSRASRLSRWGEEGGGTFDRSEMIALLGQTSPGETSLGLQARLREGEHVRGRVYDGCQLEAGRVSL